MIIYEVVKFDIVREDIYICRYEQKRFNGFYENLEEDTQGELIFLYHNRRY